jgi:hypothetical protein
MIDALLLWGVATRANPLKGGDAKLRGYGEMMIAMPVELPNESRRESNAVSKSRHRESVREHVNVSGCSLFDFYICMS